MKIKWNKKGLESVRVNDKYRIEFISSIEGEEPDTDTITIYPNRRINVIIILKNIKHYGNKHKHTI